jgi:hypothetical protein
MPASSHSEKKARRIDSVYTIVLVPHNGKVTDYKVIGTVQKSAGGPKFAFGEAAELAAFNLDHKRLEQSFAAADLSSPSLFGDAGEAADPIPALAPEARAETLLHDVCEAMTQLAAAQKDFRAELLAAYEEGEELYKLAAG